MSRHGSGRGRRCGDDGLFAHGQRQRRKVGNERDRARILSLVLQNLSSLDVDGMVQVQYSVV